MSRVEGWMLEGLGLGMGLEVVGLEVGGGGGGEVGLEGRDLGQVWVICAGGGYGWMDGWMSMDENGDGDGEDAMLGGGYGMRCFYFSRR